MNLLIPFLAVLSCQAFAAAPRVSRSPGELSRFVAGALHHFLVECSDDQKYLGCRPLSDKAINERFARYAIKGRALRAELAGKVLDYQKTYEDAVDRLTSAETDARDKRSFRNDAAVALSDYAGTSPKAADLNDARKQFKRAEDMWSAAEEERRKADAAVHDVGMKLGLELQAVATRHGYRGDILEKLVGEGYLFEP